MANIRIKDQTTDTALAAGDYVIVDNETEGTRKFDLGQKLEDIDDDFTDVREDLAELEGGGLSDDAKMALLACFQNVAWIGTDGDDYYQDLYDALYPPAPPATLTSITCVYTQSGTVYDTDTLDSLKSDLVVTAHYDNGTSQTVTAYTLSGTLEEGTSTITVSYNGKTTTFTVIVTANTVITGYTSVGTPNISGNEFTPSADGYIKTTEVFSPGDSSWAVRFKLDTVPEVTNVYSNIFRVVDNNNNGQKAIFVQKTAASNKLYISSNNSSYDVSNAEEITIPTNATIFIEIAFDGINSYTVKTSDDGEQWTTIKTITSSNKVYSGYAIAFGGPNPSGTSPYDGKFYLDTIKIYIDGSLWWQATA